MNQPEPFSAIPGVRLGKYQLLRRLAVGGMAEIFLANATGIEGFEKLVVLKRILPHLASDVRFIRRFLQEARLAARLHHQNIVQVYDIGRSDESYFYTMEYVHGLDLRNLAKTAYGQGGVPLQQALTIVIHAAAGLHYAHEQLDDQGRPLGLVHRDVSPSNILVGYDGGVKLVDFGIAKANSSDNETRPGNLIGKVTYMSPEQCSGQPLDRRSDLFSLGILLYELTTSSYLFDGPGDLAVLKQITEQPIVPPSRLQPNYPAALEPIVMRCLARAPDDRFATAQDLQAALEAFALDARMAISSLALARYLGTLFEPQVQAWRQAEAAGLTLAEYVTGSAPQSQPSDEVKTELSGLAVVADSAASVEVLLSNQHAALSSRVITPPPDRAAVRKPYRRPLRWIALGTTLAVATIAWLLSGRVDPQPTAQPSGANVIDGDAAAPSELAGSALANPSSPRPEAAPPHAGTLLIRLNVAGARIQLDDSPSVTASSRHTMQAPPGVHQLRIEATGHQPFSDAVTIGEDRTVEMAVKLVPVRRARTKWRPRGKPAPATTIREKPAGTQSPPSRIDDALVDPLGGAR